jgi:hypothetical protein
MGAGGMGMGAGAVDAEERQVLVQLRGMCIHYSQLAVALN